MPKPLLAAVVAVVVVFAVVGTVVAQSSQRFSDVSPDHPDYDAVQWAAEVGVTTGYDDGTFRPEQPLSFRHATVFLARYYEEILGADVSADFTRSDMMRVLYEMAGAPVRGLRRLTARRARATPGKNLLATPLGTARRPSTASRLPWCVGEGQQSSPGTWTPKDSTSGISRSSSGVLQTAESKLM